MVRRVLLGMEGERMIDSTGRWVVGISDIFAMIVREPDGFEYSITGETILTEAAGIFFRAAQLAAE